MVHFAALASVEASEAEPERTRAVPGFEPRVALSDGLRDLFDAA